MTLVDYSANPNQRTPCVLVLDASSSMETAGRSGITRIEALNAGLASLHEHLMEDPVAQGRVQLSIVSVGGPNNTAEIMMDWTDAINFSPFELTAGGRTPLGEGIQIGLDMIEGVKQDLRETGISYTRPWMMVISDGMPTDQASVWKSATEEAKDAERQKKLEIFAIGVEDASLEKLSEIGSKPALMLDGVKFSELFVWLSESLAAASNSRPGDELQLPSTDPWRNVKI
jgi:uncharacterized protein YegL